MDCVSKSNMLKLYYTYVNIIDRNLVDFFDFFELIEYFN